MNKGISYIEVIISFMLLSIIAAGFTSAFYVPLSGIPPLEIKQIAYSYAQREMETIMNTPFERVNSILRVTYPLDNRFEYRIDVSSLSVDLKSVWVRFYQGSSPETLAELMNYVTKKYIIEDFEENGFATPPFTWTPVTGTFGIWEIDTTLGSTKTYKFYNPSTSRTQEGHSVSDWLGARNYSVEARINIRRPDRTFISSQAFLGIRCQANGDGYYLRITSNGFITTIALIRRSGVDSVISGPLFFFANTTNIWLFARISVSGNTVTYFFDYAGGTRRTAQVIDNRPLAPGGIRLRAIAPLVRGIQRSIHFDDIKVEYFDSLTEDFEDKGISSPPFTWTPSVGTWVTVPFDGSNVYRFNDRGTTWRTSYPDWVGTTDYAVEARVYMFRADNLATASGAAIGGRCTIAGLGYYLRVDVTPTTTTITLRRGTHTGTVISSPNPISKNNFNNWLFVRLEMRGNTISFYFDDGTNVRSGSVTDFTYTNGRVYLGASAQFWGALHRHVYFDNLKIEY